jgi:predicted permease
MALSTRDLRYALRGLSRSPGFTAAAVLCLGLGIGATAAIFSVVNAVVMRPLPYRAPEQLMRVYSEFPKFPNGGLRNFWISRAEYLDLKRDLKSWESLEGWLISGSNVGGGARPERVTMSLVTGGALAMLGVTPPMGRVHAAADAAPGAPLTAVISHGLWLRAFGGDRGIVGREVRLDGRPATVIGVMPAGFAFPPGETDPPELWAPWQIDPADPGGRSNHSMSLLGRVRDGVTVAQARQEIAALVREQGARAGQNVHVFHPENHPVVTFPLHDEVVGGVRRAMLMLLGAVGFVLLISCANVANLLLARAEGRQREVAIRTAMGASPLALLRQFFVEGLVLSLGGAAVGLALAFAGLRAIVVAGEQSIPRAHEVGIDWRVLAFTLSLSLLTGMVFALAPLVRGLRGRLSESLKASGGRTTASVEASRLRKSRVVGELGLALVLLIGCGLMVQTFWRLQTVDIGLRPGALLTFRLALPEQLYPEAPAVRTFWSRLQERLSALPGVQSVTLMSGMPPIRPLNANDTEIEGFVPREGGPIQNVDYFQSVGSRFFETAGIRLIDGRYLDDRDGDGGPAVVVVNQTMANTFWPAESAIGKRIRPGFRDPWRTVVGVVADVKNAGIDKPTGAEIFLPLHQSGASAPRGMFVLMRTQGNPMQLLGAARRQLSELDAAIPMAQARSMEDVVGMAQARPRFLTLLVTLFSGVAILLAALGIYGVMSYAVAQRTAEFGIRMALGAPRGSVLRLVLRQGMALGLGGVLLGAAGAYAVTRLLGGLVFGIDSPEPMTFVAMAALLGAVVLAACYLPARRATRVDPLVALRYE